MAGWEGRVEEDEAWEAWEGKTGEVAAVLKDVSFDKISKCW